MMLFNVAVVAIIYFISGISLLLKDEYAGVDACLYVILAVNMPVVSNVDCFMYLCVSQSVNNALKNASQPLTYDNIYTTFIF